MNEITPNKLKKLYYGNGVKKTAQILDVSVPTLYKKLRKAGIKLKGWENAVYPNQKLKITLDV